MRYYKCGNSVTATVGIIDGVEISEAEYNAEIEAGRARSAKLAEHQARLEAIAEHRRSLTAEEVSRMLITRQINSLTVDDNTALRMKEFYPEWAGGVAYEPGFKVRYDGKLWRAVQPHTSQTTWEPDHTQSLWEQINESYDGTIDDPIPFEGNMVLTAGKYYYQDDAIYRCIRDTGDPMYHRLTQLTGIYVEEV